MEKRIRVLVAKPGLDGHDRGAKVVARALRDAGFEVIYTGLRQTPEQIAEAARGKKGVLVVEINAGQMVEDVRLAINGEEKVEHFGRLGGIVPEPEEIVNALKEKL